MNAQIPTTEHKPIEYRLAQVERALEQMGGTHSLQDILAFLEDGTMQSFAVGPTWAVTQVLDFPRKRVLEIFMIVGDFQDLQELFDALETFAKAKACDIIRAYGRPGWSKHSRPRGWRDDTRVYIKEVK